MIEILFGIFYDTTKEWFWQPQELIDLALEVEQTPPIDYEFEADDSHIRVLWYEWESTTECGVFRMRASYFYMHPISHVDYSVPRTNTIITITKLS